MKHLNSLVPLLHVKSVPRSIDFYRKLGFEVGHTFAPTGQSEPSWAWLNSGGAHLMVARAGEPVVASQQAVIFYVYCEDVPTFRTALQEAGVQVGEIQYPFYNQRGEFRLSDPDGYALIVTHT